MDRGFLCGNRSLLIQSVPPHTQQSHHFLVKAGRVTMMMCEERLQLGSFSSRFRITYRVFETCESGEVQTTDETAQEKFEKLSQRRMNAQDQ